MRLWGRARKVVLWSLLLSVCVLAGGLGFAYAYITDSDTLAALVKKEAPRYLPGTRLRVEKVLLRPLIGDVELHQVALWQRLDGREIELARVPWIKVRHDLRALIRGRFEPSEVIIAQLTLRVAQRKDGTWNLQGLLADPWPGPPLPTEPVVTIHKGTVELVDAHGVRTAILRDVAIRAEPTAAGPFRFEASASGDAAFGRLDLEGTFDRRTGRLELTKGNLTRLAISETFWRRLPSGWRPVVERVGLTGGEVDVTLNRLVHDPSAPRPISYEATVALRAGTWVLPERLPFPLDDVAAVARVRDGSVVLERASGRSGKTIVRAHGTLVADDPARGPLDLHVDVIDLELDDRLRAKTPPEFVELWKDYQPSGRVNLALHVVRPRAGEAAQFGLTVDCRDVAITYHLFPYRLEHIRGTLAWQGARITVDLETTVDGKPLSSRGTIDQPGPEAVVALHFEAGSMPIDNTLRGALPADVRAVVDQFRPSGSVRGTATLHRAPPGPGDPPIGQVAIGLDLDLNSGCAMTWDGLKYRITDLTGHLEIRPDQWTFKNMHGRNGLAVIAADGRVKQVGQNQHDVDLTLRAKHLPFDGQLRRALPEKWQATWAILNPKGSSTVLARIQDRPGEADDHYHLEIVPESEASVRLTLTPAPGTTGRGPSKPIELPTMDDVRGLFVFDNGRVTMSDVHFLFRESPVHFQDGTVELQDSGQFTLGVRDLEVEKLRLDAELRKIMPPLMSEFAHRLDNGQPFRVRGDLGIAWSGRPGTPAECTWDKTRVTLIDNAIQAGLPLEHLQGEIANLRGRFDGRAFEVRGALDLASASIWQQQVTRLSSPIEVAQGRAALTDLQGDLLGGELTGRVEVSLDATPKYTIKLNLREADLQRFTSTLPGRQDYRGKASGWVDLGGMGNDLKTLSGRGAARIDHGDLGKLPVLLRLFAALNLSKETKTAFDTADVAFTVGHGEAQLDPIKFTGNAFSLRGSGTFDLQGDLDLRLHPLYGRDELLHVRGLSDAMREFGGQFFDIRVTGPIAYPKVAAEPLPGAFERGKDFVQNFGKRRAGRGERR